MSSEKKAVLLEQWGAANFDPPPSLWTLRAMARAGKISPAPQRVGHKWYVASDACHIDMLPKQEPQPKRQARRPRRTALYRHFDGEGRLLYVGISLNAVARLAQHTDSHWTKQITRVEVEYFPYRAAAAEAEIDAIQNERPLHNIRHAEPA